MGVGGHGGGIRGSLKGGCLRSWWGNKGQCERWVLEVMVGRGGGGNKGQCERWVLEVMVGRGGGGGAIRGSVKGGWAGGAKGWVLDVLLRGGWMGAG